MLASHIGERGACHCVRLSSAQTVGIQLHARERIFNRVTDIGKAEMQDISVPSLITRTTNDVNQIQMIVSMGLQMMKNPLSWRFGRLSKFSERVGNFRR